ncbi:MAG: 2-amino-4-hydroxy-6-hydroxymethyldihydropteridine diphosphokinase [Bacillota bacterium]|nr:2-amino-4-hydroxy-6-hydroxymethyldihydropteridine diphosphokinase [Bacillota bacterium]
MRTIIALGSNMGDRQKYIDDALIRMEERVGHITACSGIMETKAYGITDQADFLNMVIAVETEKEPRQLLAALNGIEAELDRVRLIRWGPRTIDLDIIFYEDRIIDEEDLHIPHIDMYSRRFVLEPAAQIAPDQIDPRTGKTVSRLLKELTAARGGQEHAAGQVPEEPERG